MSIKNILIELENSDDNTKTEILHTGNFKFDSCPYNVGDVFITTFFRNPAETWPGTTWSRLPAGTMPMNTNISGNALTTGGGDVVTTAMMPVHNHTTPPHTHAHSANHRHGSGWGEREQDSYYVRHGIFTLQWGYGTNANQDWDDADNATSYANVTYTSSTTSMKSVGGNAAYKPPYTIVYILVRTS